MTVMELINELMEYSADKEVILALEVTTDEGSHWTKTLCVVEDAAAVCENGDAVQISSDLWKEVRL